MIQARPILLLAAFAALLAGGCKPKEKTAAQRQGEEILVFAAASLREAMEELGAGFERDTGVRVVFNFAGSNDLAHQIMATRGPDLFLSASKAWMDTVQSAGRVLPGRARMASQNLLKSCVAVMPSSFALSAGSRSS